MPQTTNPMTAARFPLAAFVAVVSLLLATFAATGTARATTEHCDNHASAAVKIEAETQTEGSFELDGTTVTYTIDGDTVVFTDDAGDPVLVEFCVKAAASNSGVIVASEYTVDFMNSGGQTPAISYVAVYGVEVDVEAPAEVDAEAIVITAVCATADGTNLFRIENTGAIDIAAGLLTWEVEGTMESGALDAIAAGGSVEITTTTTGSVTLLVYLDAELLAEVASSDAPCEQAVDKPDLTVITVDGSGDLLADVELTLASDVQLTDSAGAAVFADLDVDAYVLAVTDVPEAACAVEGELDVTVAADGTIDVTDANVGTGIEIGSWTAATNTLVIELPCDVLAGGESDGDTPAESDDDTAAEADVDADVAAGGEGAAAAGQGGVLASGQAGSGTGELPDTAAGAPLAPLATLLLTLLPLGAIAGHLVISRRR